MGEAGLGWIGAKLLFIEGDEGTTAREDVGSQRPLVRTVRRGALVGGTKQVAAIADGVGLLDDSNGDSPGKGTTKGRAELGVAHVVSRDVNGPGGRVDKVKNRRALGVVIDTGPGSCSAFRDFARRGF